MELRTKLLSALNKVFLDEEPTADYHPAGVWGNERFSFQLAWNCPDGLPMRDDWLLARISPAYKDHVTLYQVEHVPCRTPCLPDADDDVLRRRPGLFPDALLPCPDGRIYAVDGQWNTLWFEVDPAALAPGQHRVEVSLEAPDGSRSTQTAVFTRLPGQLPARKLRFTQWFHYDCLADWYGVKVFSPEHWKLVWAYLDCAVAHGVDTLLVPLVTPPLDTLPGRERPTVQLVDIYRNGGGSWQFNFDRLGAFMAEAQRRGILAFEMTPLFTQWGALAAPKVMATVDGRYQRVFGWDTPADGAEYTAFLQAFLPALAAWLRSRGLAETCYFHVSDEPQKPEHFPHYKKASALMQECLPGFTTMDAVSDAEVCRMGGIQVPVASTTTYDALQRELGGPLWAYYCWTGYKKVSNHLIAFPGQRTRIFGMQLYRQQAQGFLHWGYNFWNTKYSADRLDPWADTDAHGAYPSGDPFLVYPGKNGQPVSSIRQKQLAAALWDVQALEYCEQLAGRDTVFALLDRCGPMDFKEYPRAAGALYALRASIDEKILENLG